MKPAGPAPSSAGGFQLKETVAPESVEERPVGAAGGVFEETGILFRHSCPDPVSRKSSRPSLS